MSELFDQDAFYDPNVDRLEFAIREYEVTARHLIGAIATAEEEDVSSKLVQALNVLATTIKEEYDVDPRQQ